MTQRPSIRGRLARPFDPAELRRIKRLWVRHSIAEDSRDIDGLIATLASDCAYFACETVADDGRKKHWLQAALESLEHELERLARALGSMLKAA